MAWHRFEIEIYLTDRELCTMARAAASKVLAQEVRSDEWSISAELRTLLHFAMIEEGYAQQARDNAARLARRIKAPAPPTPSAPDWIRALLPSPSEES
jgi:DNA-binding MurR/RpiR family transcriptional regulator